jgi:hypothetical protein
MAGKKKVHFTKRVPRARVFKSIISPVQAWLLSRGKCVGCGVDLSAGKKESHKKGFEKVTCNCGRIFVLDVGENKYRRALFEEV